MVASEIIERNNATIRQAHPGLAAEQRPTKIDSFTN